ncbi:MAG: hypothetical protein QOC84_1300 [Bradyrhizobium sp.]|jgi:hypothetical protein|nr:hypothetical protein [Bradyrhizobium sp.]
MTILARLHFNSQSANLSLRKRFRLFFTVATVVVLLGGVKAAVHYSGLEFLQLNALLTSGIGGAIFIIGFLLSGILADYKEAERVPAEIRTTITPPFDYFPPGMLSSFVTYFNNSRVIKLHSNTAVRMTDRRYSYLGLPANTPSNRNEYPTPTM